VTVAVSDTVNVAPGQVGDAFVVCPAGAVAVGGGAFASLGRMSTYPLVAKDATSPGGWGRAGWNDTGTDLQFTAYAVCASR